MASAELKQLVRIRSDEKEVFYLYNECLQLRIQWNIVRGVVNRLEYDQMINKGCYKSILLISMIFFHDFNFK